MDAVAATALAKQIAIRHREPGHLRLVLPTALLPAAADLIAALRRQSGVYRVEQDDERLSIRYQALACSEREVARALKNGVLALPADAVIVDNAAAPAGSATADAAPPPDLAALAGAVGRQLVPALTATGRALIDLVQGRTPAAVPATAAPSAAPEQAGTGTDEATGAAGTASAGDLGQRLQALLQGALTERAAINFCNDILAFYLIKVHWDLIIGRWLKDPMKFRNAWLTVFYLVFLLIRYRKLQAARS
jgi:hypothetical protein